MFIYRKKKSLNYKTEQADCCSSNSNPLRPWLLQISLLLNFNISNSPKNVGNNEWLPKLLTIYSEQRSLQGILKAGRGFIFFKLNVYQKVFANIQFSKVLTLEGRSPSDTPVIWSFSHPLALWSGG